LVLGKGRGRPRVDMIYDDTRRELHLARQRRVVTAGVHDDLVAECAEVPRQVGNVHVLPACVDATDQRQRARMLRHQCDLHCVISRWSSSCGRSSSGRMPNLRAAARAPMPKRSMGMTLSIAGIRSVPVTRHLRSGSLTTTAARLSSPVYWSPGSTMPCSITRCG